MTACQCDGWETAKMKSRSGLSCCIRQLPHKIIPWKTQTHLCIVPGLAKHSAPICERVPHGRLERREDVIELLLHLPRDRDDLVPTKLWRELVDRRDATSRDSGFHWRWGRCRLRWNGGRCRCRWRTAAGGRRKIWRGEGRGGGREALSVEEEGTG